MKQVCGSFEKLAFTVTISMEKCCLSSNMYTSIEVRIHSDYHTQKEKGNNKTKKKIIIMKIIIMKKNTNMCIKFPTIGINIPLLTSGNEAFFSLISVMIMSLRSIIFTPSHGRTTLLQY